MERPVAINSNIPPGRILIDVANIKAVDRQWIGGAFGVHIAFKNESFVVIPESEAALLEQHGLLPTH